MKLLFILATISTFVFFNDTFLVEKHRQLSSRRRLESKLKDLSSKRSLNEKSIFQDWWTHIVSDDKQKKPTFGFDLSDFWERFSAASDNSRRHQEARSKGFWGSFAYDSALVMHKINQDKIKKDFEWTKHIDASLG